METSSATRRPYEPELVSDAGLVVGEGPLWCAAHPSGLLWIDHEGEIRLYDPRMDEDRPLHRRRGHVAGVRRRERGGFVVALERSVHAFDGARVEETPIAVVERDAPRLLNDTTVDPAGRLWLALYDPAFGDATGEVLRLEADGSVAGAIGGLTLPNGMGFSPAGDAMYVVDSFAFAVYAYAFDRSSGTVSERRTVWSAHDGGYPDGLAVDVDGNLWVAFWEGGAVRCISPRGELQREIRFPVTLTSSCAFGGPELADLYVTSARYELADDVLAAQPLAGALFRVATDVVGAPTFAFAG